MCVFNGVHEGPDGATDGKLPAALAADSQNLEAIKVAYADKLLAIDGNQDKMEVAGAIKKAMA